MEENKDNYLELLYQGLQALSDSAFPKKCANCGLIYETMDDFLSQTKEISQKSGLKQSYDDDDSTIVELYRNCVCGSTLMDFCSDRRDTSASGLQRREKFSSLIEHLGKAGIDTGTARTELLKVMNGEISELLKNIKPPE